MAAVAHDNVVHVYQVAEERGTPFLAMPLLAGESLEARLRREKVLPHAEVLRIGRETAQGLAAAHARGLIHRDVKPRNIWLEGEHGRVKLLDFGLARATDADVRLTQEGRIAGTPAYMAPEQAQARDCDPRCDLFSLGCVLYQASTGRLPFRGDNDLAILVSLTTDQPPPPRQVNPAVPAPLSDLIVSLLSKDPNHRPATAQAVVAAIRALEQTATAQLPATPPVSPMPAPRRSRPRRRFLAVAAAVVFLIAAGLLAQFIIIRIRDREGRETRIEVPPGSTVTIEQADKVTPVPPDGGLRLTRPPVAATPAVALDQLRRADIPPDELAQAGGGDPSKAPEGLVAILGNCRLKHWNYVKGVAYSPDGKVLASASKDHTVKLWDSATGKALRTLTGHTAEVHAVAYSPDGRLIASGGGDSAVRLWDAASGEPLPSPFVHTGAVYAVAFSPDGKRLASGSYDRRVMVWETATGRELHNLSGHKGPVNAVAFSLDGKTVVSGSDDGTVRVWDLSSAKERHTLAADKVSVAAVAISPDGTLIASGGRQGPIQLWELNSGREVGTLGTSTPGSTLSLAFSSNGQTLVSCDLNGAPWLWHVGRRERLRGYQTLGMAGPAVAFRPDGQGFAIGYSSGAVGQYDLATEQARNRFPGHQGYVSAVALAPTGQTLVSAGWDRSVRVWDAATGSEKQTIAAGSYIPYAALSPDGRTMVTSESLALCWYDLPTGQRLRQRLFKGRPAGQAFSPDGKTLVTANYNGTVNVWDAQTGEERRVLPGHKSAYVIHIAYRPDGKVFASGDYAGVIKVWDAATFQELHTLKHRYPVYGLTFSPDGKLLASGDAFGTIKLWDAATGTEVRELTGPKANVVSLAFSPDGRMLVSATEAGLLQFWDVQSGRRLKELRLGPSGGIISAVVFSPDGRHLLTANGNGTIYVFRLASAGGAGTK